MIEYRDVVGFICKLCTGFFNSMINIFILRCVDTETEDYYYYFADQPDIVLPTAYTTKN